MKNYAQSIVMYYKAIKLNPKEAECHVYIQYSI